MAESRGMQVGDIESGFKRYPRYRDSGVKWLGDIPAHWEVRRLKTTATVQLSNVDKKTMPGQVPVALCNYVDVYYNNKITDRIDFMLATATEEQVERFALRRGDVLITKDSEDGMDIAVPALVAETLPGVVCGYHLAQIKPIAVSDGSYLARAFVAAGVCDQFSVAANGITRFGLTSRAIGDSVFPLPPLPEQRAIALFLDRETGRVDRLIVKKQRLVELLHEKRTSLISRAVTRGLDPEARMRDPGTARLGAIPAHWDLIELGRIGEFWKGRGGTKLDEQETGVPCIRYGDLYTCHHHFVHRARSCVAPEVAGNYTSIRYGDVLFAASGETVEDIGKSAVNLLRSEAVCGGDIILFRSQRDCVPKFMGYAMGSPHAVYQKARMGRGFTVAHIYIPQLRQLRIPLPPPREQRMIADHLDHETRKLDTLVKKISYAIDRLLEYRSSVISAAVTGRIDVREKSIRITCGAGLD
ncbi:MAG: hypothetical protein F4Y41_04675 [Gammaproteobacteria bacterium]|nr:hypothetical protein [Gammaproteobacteria bacterium]MYI22321.1 hypothetical protein [Gammaproteobacteria bacterium]